MCGYHIPQPQPCQLSEKPQLSEVSTGSPILRRSESLERKGRIYGERYGEKPDIEKKIERGSKGLLPYLADSDGNSRSRRRLRRVVGSLPGGPDTRGSSLRPRTAEP